MPQESLENARIAAVEALLTFDSDADRRLSKFEFALLLHRILRISGLPFDAAAQQLLGLAEAPPPYPTAAAAAAAPPPAGLTAAAAAESSTPTAGLEMTTAGAATPLPVPSATSPTPPAPAAAASSAAVSYPAVGGGLPSLTAEDMEEGDRQVEREMQVTNKLSRVTAMADDG